MLQTPHTQATRRWPWGPPAPLDWRMSHHHLHHDTPPSPCSQLTCMPAQHCDLRNTTGHSILYEPERDVIFTMTKRHNVLETVPLL
jgi:hypothetical protein